MIFDIPPKDFNPKIKVSSCIIMHGDKFLMLQRSAHKFEGGTWQLPGGKIEKRESELDAVIRETFEETGLKISKNLISFVTSMPVRYEEFDFDYHIFKISVKETPKIVLRSNEHQQYEWLTLDEVLKRKNVKDGAESIVRAFKVLRNE